jgi:hypothetical protein
MPHFTLQSQRFLIPCALLLTLTACGTDREKVALRQEVNQLSSKLDSLIDALELQRENDSVTIDESSVLLTPGDSSAFIKTGVGYLTAHMDSFRDFGSGSKVNLRFGNPGNVSLKGMRARLEWHVRTERGDSEMQIPVIYKFLEDLEPGRLSKTSVIINDIPAGRMLGVRVSRVRFEQIDFKEDVKAR